MRFGMRRILGVLVAAFILAGAGLVATAVPANADSDCELTYPLAFDINGEYLGVGVARPRICTNHNLLTIDMFAFGSPTPTVMSSTATPSA